MNIAYFDYAATTPLDPKVSDAMTQAQDQYFGNPSSVHVMGRAASQILDRSRDGVAKHLGCHFSEIYFTSGATESNNLALLGLEKALAPQFKKMHFITTGLEHPSVLEPLRSLVSERVALTLIPATRSGEVEVDRILAAITDTTVCISVMMVNNETGIAQPINEIGKRLKASNLERKKNGLPRIFFHVDASQGALLYNIQCDDLGADLVTISSHKIYGPKGVGILYARKSTPLAPLFFGGPQEKGLRPGTEALAPIVGLDAALKLVHERREHDYQHCMKFRQKTKDLIARLLPEAMFHEGPNQAPHILNTSFPGYRGEQLLLNLDMLGVCASHGSACSSGAMTPSSALVAMGIPMNVAENSIRFSFGRDTQEADLKILERALKKILI